MSKSDLHHQERLFVQRNLVQNPICPEEIILETHLTSLSRSDYIGNSPYEIVQKKLHWKPTLLIGETSRSMMQLPRQVATGKTVTFQKHDAT